jgi:hypothetical protein
MISSTQFSEFAESRVRLPENSVRNPFENFGILCAKIFRPLDERGSAKKDAKITQTDGQGSRVHLARWRPCHFPLPSALGAISPPSFEQEHDDQHEHLVADFGVTHGATPRNAPGTGAGNFLAVGGA